MAVTLAPVHAVTAQATPCSFTLGFATLHDLIPNVVGSCLDNEFPDPHTGDALQHTTNGLLAWRTADNWTALTDGFQSWVNGPLGVQQRLNDQRLWWEANPDHLPIVPPPRPGERCHTAGLDLALVGVDAGAGNLVGTFRFTDTLNVECTFFGYPGAQLFDDAGDPLPTTVVRGGGYFTSDPPPTVVDVQAHNAATFHVHWEQVPVNDEPTSPMAARLAVTPPDEISGVPATVNAFTLETVLRDEWQWPGIVLSDYTAIKELIPHGVATDLRQAAHLSIMAGCDMDVMSDAYGGARPGPGVGQQQQKPNSTSTEAGLARLPEVMTARGRAAIMRGAP